MKYLKFVLRWIFIFPILILVGIVYSLEMFSDWLQDEDMYTSKTLMSFLIRDIKKLTKL